MFGYENYIRSDQDRDEPWSVFGRAAQLRRLVAAQQALRSAICTVLQQTHAGRPWMTRFEIAPIVGVDPSLVWSSLQTLCSLDEVVECTEGNVTVYAHASRAPALCRLELPAAYYYAPIA